MVKVFSKHKSSEVREWASKLMQSYQLLHAVEKPMNLDYAKPFSNTSNLANMTPKIHVDLAEQREENARKQRIKDLLRKHGISENDEILMEEDITQSFSSSREAIGKEQSKSDEQDQQELQEFKLFYQREHTVGYLMRKMPYHYQVFKRLLHEVKQRVPHLTQGDAKISVLDYGAGLGSGLWAAIHCFGQERIIRTAAVEPNVNMRKLGKFLTQDLDEKGNILWTDSLAMIPGTGGERGKFDVVILGYVLQEVSNPRGREMIIEALWQRVKDGGIMILVEPGSPKGFRYVHDFRNWIIAKERSEACIVAPCPHHSVCPMARHPDLWCNFS